MTTKNGLLAIQNPDLPELIILTTKNGLLAIQNPDLPENAFQKPDSGLQDLRFAICDLRFAIWETSLHNPYKADCRCVYIWVHTWLHVSTRMSYVCLHTRLCIHLYTCLYTCLDAVTNTCTVHTACMHVLHEALVVYIVDSCDSCLAVGKRADVAQARAATRGELRVSKHRIPPSLVVRAGVPTSA